jgi:hypothetical protein
LLVAITKWAGGPNARTPDSDNCNQLIGYALLAQKTFGIDTVAIFNARYAHFHQWSLKDLLKDLAGRPVNLSTAGQELEAFLQDPTCAQAPALARAAAERRRREGKLQSELLRAKRFKG